MLIDTDNTPAFPSRQVFKGDVWDSLSSLDLVPKSQLLAPQGATSVTKPSAETTASTATDTLDWSLISGEVSNEGQVEGDEYCYQPTISGTVTDEELQLEKQAREKDNLVDFDSMFASPFPNSTTPKSDLLDFDESNGGAVFDTLKETTPTLATDTPRSMSPVIPPNTTSDSETATYTKTENDEAIIKPKKKSTKLRSKVQINDIMYMASFDCVSCY